MKQILILFFFAIATVSFGFGQTKDKRAEKLVEEIKKWIANGRLNLTEAVI